MGKKFARRFLIQSALLLLLVEAAVALADPFYHYHAPAAGLKAVVNNAEYQCIGTIRNFEYDGLLLGSSVAENYNNRWLDEAFNCTTIKGIKSSASTMDLLYYLEEAYQKHELRYVFYNLDLFALRAELKCHFADEGMPVCLYNDRKDFGEDERAVIDADAALLIQMVEAHPETEFYFFYPPYSLLWWDAVNRDGRIEECLYAAGRAAEALIPYENVHLYNFLAEEEIVCNLNYYMDAMHFSADINRWIVEQLKGSDYLLTEENYEEKTAQLGRLAERMTECDIKEYFAETGGET